MAFDPDGPPKLPDLTSDFPLSVPNVKINPDLDNPAHDPHYDIITGIDRGVDKLRIDPSGDLIDGETQIGPVKMPWEP